MTPPRLRLVLVLGAALSLAATGASAEILYRARVHGEFASLERSVRSSHADGIHRGTRFIRFGAESGSLQTSLADDLVAWFLRRAGLRSRLDFSEPIDRDLHAYHLVVFDYGDDRHHWCHVYLWSPRESRFVHYMNWDYYNPCTAEDCPWPNDPPRPR